MFLFTYLFIPTTPLQYWLNPAAFFKSILKIQEGGNTSLIASGKIQTVFRMPLSYVFFSFFLLVVSVLFLLVYFFACVFSFNYFLFSLFFALWFAVQPAHFWNNKHHKLCAIKVSHLIFINITLPRLCELSCVQPLNLVWRWREGRVLCSDDIFRAVKLVHCEHCKIEVVKDVLALFHVNVWNKSGEILKKGQSKCHSMFFFFIVTAFQKKY